MPSDTARAIRRAAAPLLLMGLIFFLSAQTDPGLDRGVVDLLVRKLAHVAEYATLTLLWAWALGPVLGRRAVAMAALIALLYAAGDEFHQSYVEGRNGTPVDVAIDTLGIVLGSTALVYHRRTGMENGDEAPR